MPFVGRNISAGTTGGPKKKKKKKRVTARSRAAAKTAHTNAQRDARNAAARAKTTRYARDGMGPPGPTAATRAHDQKVKTAAQKRAMRAELQRQRKRANRTMRNS